MNSILDFLIAELAEKTRREFVEFSMGPAEEFDPCGTTHTQICCLNGEAKVFVNHNQAEALANLTDEQVEELNTLLYSAHTTGNYLPYGHAVAGMVFGYWKALAEEESERRIPSMSYGVN